MLTSLFIIIIIFFDLIMNISCVTYEKVAIISSLVPKGALCVVHFLVSILDLGHN